MDVQDAIRQAMNEAMDKTIDELIVKLKEYIQERVYDKYDPDWYDRTMEVLNNWVKQSATWNNNSTSGALYFDDAQFTHSGFPKYQHGIQQIDAETLLDILNEKVPWGDAFGTNFNQSRAFWDDYVNWVNDNWEDIFYKNFDM